MSSSKRVIMSVPMQECPHCHKIVGVAIVRSVKFKKDLLMDSNEVECPRQECGKLIGYLEVK